MLDRKTKDEDASIELLEDRRKFSKIIFFCFFVFGWMTAVLGITLIPLNWRIGEVIAILGFAFLIFATWFFNNWNYYSTIIIIKKPLQKE